MEKEMSRFLRLKIFRGPGGWRGFNSRRHPRRKKIETEYAIRRKQARLLGGWFSAWLGLCMVDAIASERNKAEEFYLRLDNGEPFWDGLLWSGVREGLWGLGESHNYERFHSIVGWKGKMYRWRMRQEILMSAGKLDPRDCVDWEYAYCQWAVRLMEIDALEKMGKVPHKNQVSALASWRKAFLYSGIFAGETKDEYDACRILVDGETHG